MFSLIDIQLYRMYISTKKLCCTMIIMGLQRLLFDYREDNQQNGILPIAIRFTKPRLRH